MSRVKEMRQLRAPLSTAQRHDANVITGAVGYDVLSGGGGDDAFVLRVGFRVDYISDFAAGAGAGDVIYAEAAVFANFATVLTNSFQSGADTVIVDGLGDTLVLANVNRLALSADDFSFF